MREVTTRTGARLPVLGQGTWEMGDEPKHREQEIAALRTGFDLGLTLVDTAEMYGGGAAETLVGEAIAGRRNELFIVTKVLPENASRQGAIRAAEQSLRRLRSDHVDLYLLHWWEGEHPIEETFAAFEELAAAGKVLHYGVSNYDLPELRRAEELPAGARVAANQVLYALGRRSAEASVIPWCQERGVTLMAYSPLEQGNIVLRSALKDVAARHGVTPAAAALAWATRLPGVMAIVKAAKPEHVRENVAATEITLTEDDLRELDAAYPPPASDANLESL